MRYDYINYGPHSISNYETFYYYSATNLLYGYPLNDANDSIAWGIAFEKSGTVSGIGFYVVEYLGAPDYVLGMVTVSGNPISAGDPYPNADPNRTSQYPTELFSNSQWEAYHPEVVGSGWVWFDLATQVTVNKGDHAAIVIMPSGSTIPNTSNYVELNDESTYWTTFPGQWRYTTYWSYSTWNNPIAIKYTDNTTQGLQLIGLPWEEFNSPEEWGLEFKLPFQATCLGATFNLYPVDTYPSNSPLKVILSDSSDGELASKTIDDYGLIDNYNNNNTTIVWDTSTDPVLDANTVYRLYLKPTSAEAIDKKGFILENEAAKGDLIGGTDWKWIERNTPASGWTYQPTYYPWISIVITDIQGGTSPSGNGGGGNASYGFIG